MRFFVTVVVLSLWALVVALLATSAGAFVALSLPVGLVILGAVFDPDLREPVRTDPHFPEVPFDPRLLGPCAGKFRFDAEGKIV